MVKINLRPINPGVNQIYQMIQLEYYRKVLFSDTLKINKRICL